MSVDPEMECLHIGYDQMPWQNKAIIDKGNIYTLAMNATVYGNWILANSKTTSVKWNHGNGIPRLESISSSDTNIPSDLTSNEKSCYNPTNEPTILRTIYVSSANTSIRNKNLVFLKKKKQESRLIPIKEPTDFMNKVSSANTV
jgi:hypothetical protein